MDNSDTPTLRSAPKTLQMGFMLAPGFTLLPFTGFVEVLRQAADEGDLSRQIWCRWSVMSQNLEAIQASCGVAVQPWEKFRDPEEFDYIVVVGGLLSHMPRVEPAFYDYLKSAAKAGVSVVGLCTGSYILAEAGLLDGRRCAVHWYHYQDFSARYPKAKPMIDELFVQDGRFWTSPGGSASLDLALHLVSRHLGPERVLKVLRHTIVDWTRPSNHPQTPFMDDYTVIHDHRVRKAVFLMEKDLAAPLSIEEIAAQVNTSARQLERLFKSFLGLGPAEYFRRLRLKQAHWLLSRTTLPVTIIAHDCGFTDSSHLAKRFKEFFGHPPGKLRRQSTAVEAAAGRTDWSADSGLAANLPTAVGALNTEKI